MEMVDSCLKPGGFLCSTLWAAPNPWFVERQWITKYIFPNTQVPSVGQIGEAIDGLFVLEDWENLSTDYERTLLAWCENFKNNYSRSKAPMMRASTDVDLLSRYLRRLVSRRALQLWQVVVSKAEKLAATAGKTTPAICGAASETKNRNRWRRSSRALSSLVLAPSHDVTIFEAGNRIGGHAWPFALKRMAASM